MWEPAPGEFAGTPRFRVEARLGSGAFGVVYRVFDSERRQSIALKILNNDEADSLYRFKREFRALANVRHPNLVSFHELISDGERWFLTMELVDGVDFLEYVRAQRAPDSELPFDPDRLVASMRQLAEGISALHTAGILHRDIKPSNVLVTFRGQVKILDFGLSTDLAPQGVAASLSSLGTPTYVAPEQAIGTATTTAADWYSVGVMLFEALTGRPPFTGKVLEVVIKKQTADAPAPSSLMPGLPEPLDHLAVALLSREPQSRPSGTAVLAALGSTTAPTPVLTRTTGMRAFVGRHAELAAITGAYQVSARGRGVLARVHGGSGAGKSAFVRRFLDALSVHEPRALILSGRCYDRESMPFKAVDSLIDDLSTHLKSLSSAVAGEIVPSDVYALARLFPVLRQVKAVDRAPRPKHEARDSGEVRRRAAGALRELLRGIAARRPVALFVDDLHWGDADSAPLLAEILRPPGEPRLLFIASYRTEEVETSPFLRAFLPLVAQYGVETHEIELEELSAFEARDLSMLLLGDDAPNREEVAEAVARESGGNPYFIHELVRYTQEVGQFDQLSMGSSWSSAPDPSWTLLDEIICDRVSTVPEKSRRLLELLAIAGRPLEIGVVRQAASLDGDDLILVDQLRLGRLVRTRGVHDEDLIELYRERIRRALLARIPAKALKDYHLRLAFALESAAHPDPEALAMHLLEGGERWLAAKQAVTAADRAAEMLAFDRAAHLYTLALDLEPSLADEQRDLQLKLADAIAHAGRGAEAAEIYLAAAEREDATTALELKRRAAEQLIRSGHIDDGLAILRQLTEALGLKIAETPRRAFASLVARRFRAWMRGVSFDEHAESDVPAETLLRIDTCWSVATGLSLVDTVRGADFQTQHLLLALEAGEPYRVSRALAVEAGYRAASSDRGRRQAEELNRQATEIAERIGHPHALSIGLTVRSIIAFLDGHWQEAREYGERAEALLREQCTGVAWELQTAVFYLVRSLEMLGEIGVLAERLPVLLSEARARGDLWASTNLRVRLAYLTHLAADDPDTADAEVVEAISSWTNQGFHMQHYWALGSRVSIAAYRGDGLGAWALLSSEWSERSGSMLMRIQLLRIEGLLLRARTALAAAATGASGTDDLLDVARRNARRMEREEIDWATALAGLVYAGAAAIEGDAARAAPLFEAAEATLEVKNMKLYAAAARRARGTILGGDEGAALVAAADEWMRSQRIVRPERFAGMLVPSVVRSP